MFKNFKELFTEITEGLKPSDYKIYFEDNTLWVAYGQGSGATSYMPNIEKFLTSGKGKNHDSIVDRLLTAASAMKPMKSAGNASLYEVPYYGKTEYGKTLDIWGGNIKPAKKYYMVITIEKDTIVNFFNNKNEAQSWINSIN